MKSLLFILFMISSTFAEDLIFEPTSDNLSDKTFFSSPDIDLRLIVIKGKLSWMIDYKTNISRLNQESWYIQWKDCIDNGKFLFFNRMLTKDFKYYGCFDIGTNDPFYMLSYILGLWSTRGRYGTTPYFFMFKKDFVFASEIPFDREMLSGKNFTESILYDFVYADPGDIFVIIQ